uniref:Uncharacterized protein n=1 Tax=Anguilla anguilla TaxID=7936 RepID=A0A0E9PQM6_ANGAN
MAGSQGTCLLYFITAVSQMEATTKTSIHRPNR